MQIKILGTRANIDTTAPGHFGHSGILLDNLFLFDTGEEKYLEEKFKYLLYTHLHPDHAYFVYSGKEFPEHHKSKIYAPEKHSKIPEAIVLSENEKLQLAGYEITCIPVIHSLKVKSLGFIIAHQNKRIFISGDVAWIEKKHKENFKRFDLVITEGSYIRKGGMVRRDQKTGKIFGHTGIPDLIKMFEPYTGRIILTHLGTWFMKEMLVSEEKIRSLNTSHLIVEAAHDGQIITI